MTEETKDEETKDEEKSEADTSAEDSNNESDERTFTQKEVNALLAKETSKLKRRIKKQNQEQTKTQTSNDDTVNALGKILDRLEALESASEKQGKKQKFDALLNGREIDADVKELIFSSYDPEKPEASQKLIEKFTKGDDGEGSNESTSDYRSPGAPSSSKDMSRGINPMTWTQDDISVLRSEGRFIDQLEKWRSTLPGGGSNLFHRKKKI